MGFICPSDSFFWQQVNDWKYTLHVYNHLFLQVPSWATFVNLYAPEIINEANNFLVCIIWTWIFQYFLTCLLEKEQNLSNWLMLCLSMQKPLRDSQDICITDLCRQRVWRQVQVQMLYTYINMHNKCNGLTSVFLVQENSVQYPNHSMLLSMREFMRLFLVYKMGRVMKQQLFMWDIQKVKT